MKTRRWIPVYEGRMSGLMCGGDSRRMCMRMPQEEYRRIFQP